MSLGSRLTLRGLQITQQFPKGLKVEIFCKGSKCPFKRKTLKLGKVRRASASAIGSLTSKQRRFRAGQTLEVWASAPGFNTKVSRYALKYGKDPGDAALLRDPSEHEAPEVLYLNQIRSVRPPTPRPLGI